VSNDINNYEDLSTRYICK